VYGAAAEISQHAPGGQLLIAGNHVSNVLAKGESLEGIAEKTQQETHPGAART
jgi:hypothetical protein